MYDIATIGTASLDVFLEVEHITRQKAGAHKKMSFCLPIGEKVPITNLEQHFGGNAANTAVGFSRLGLKTSMVSSLGTCSECVTIVENLQKEGVTTQFIKKDHGTEVNVAYVLDWQKEKDDRVILSYHQPKNFKKIKWPKTKWFYLTSLGTYAKSVWKQLPRDGKLIFNPGGGEINAGVQFMLPLLRRTEVLIVNRCEAVQLLSLEERKGESTNFEFLLSNLLKLGPRIVVVTCGIEGVYAQSEEDAEPTFLSALEVPPKEVTGAGDAFSSGFTSAYIQKKPLEEALKWGMLNAAYCIKEIGAQNGLLTARKLKKRYKEHY